MNTLKATTQLERAAPQAQVAITGLKVEAGYSG